MRGAKHLELQVRTAYDTSVYVLQHKEHRDKEVSCLLLCQLVFHQGLLFGEGRGGGGSRWEQTGELWHFTQWHLILRVTGAAWNNGKSTYIIYSYMYILLIMEGRGREMKRNGTRIIQIFTHSYVYSRLGMCQSWSVHIYHAILLLVSAYLFFGCLFLSRDLSLSVLDFRAT